MPRHGGARNKAGCPNETEQPARRGQPLSPGASLPDFSRSRGAPATSVKEARLNREARAVHEVDRRREWKAT
jgi:hypothetical protein